MQSTRLLSKPRLQSGRYTMGIMRQWMREYSGTAVDFAFGGEPPAPPAGVLELIHQDAASALKAADASETDRFVELAAEMLYREYGLSVTAECILPVPGGRAAINALIASTLSPDDAVLVTEPSYPAFARTARQHGSRVLTARQNPDRGFELDLELLRESLNSLRLAALNYPNNPTGATLSRRTLVDLGRRIPNDALFFNDATYGLLSYAAPPCSLLSESRAIGLAQPVLELHSLSKLFGLGPLPVAFFVGDMDVIQTLREYSEFIWGAASALQIRVGTLCLANADHIRATRTNLSRRITRLHAVLDAAGFEPFSTAAGLYVLCRSTGFLEATEPLDPWTAAERLLKQFGIAAMPCEAPPDGYLRFSAQCTADALTALKQCIQFQQRTPA